MTKKDASVLAAEKRAAVISIVTKAAGPIPAYEMFKDPILEKFKFTWTTFQAFVGMMKTKQLIDSVEIDDPKAKVGYIPLNAKLTVDKGEKKVKVVKVPKVKESVTIPNLKIDVIKSTGKVRLEFNGLSIEIGVID